MNLFFLARVTMIGPKQPWGLGSVGLFFALWTIFILWRGEIWNGRSVVSRSSEPGPFYTWVVCYAIIALVFLGAATYALLHA